MSDYSALDRLFHRIVLSGRSVGEALFDLDGARVDKGLSPASAPVIVTGLARAGTTVLMRALHRSGQFASLTYADMPMVMAPNLWAALSHPSKKQRVARERAHGDGVVVDYDAPEALEEVFWRTRCGADYIRPEGLIAHEPDAESIAAYQRYQARICRRYGARRYLAKNNNMMLRLASVAAALPDGLFLIPVRDPLAQADSLRRQHQRFVASDAFTRDYMRWLAHHEFGGDQRPFLFPGGPSAKGDREGIDYWLALWIGCYQHLSGAMGAAPNVAPVIYERLPEDWPAIARLAGVDPATGDDLRPANSGVPEEGASPELLEVARALYTRLAHLAAERLA